MRGTLLVLIFVGACDNDVRVHLMKGSCESQGLADVLSVSVELMREDKSISLYIPCVNTDGLLRSLTELEGMLGATPPLSDIPEGGRWDLWVIGRSTSCQDEVSPPLTLLCGRAFRFDMPPPGYELSIPIDCEDRLSDSETRSKIKEKIKTCESGSSTVIKQK
jgi:hypothetical protein